MAHYDELINQLSDLYGIIPEYWDIFGNRHIASIETKKCILRAMKIDTASEESLAAALDKEREKPWSTFIEPVKVLSVNAQPFIIEVHVPVDEGEEQRLTYSYSLENEHGNAEESIFAGRALPVKDLQWIGGKRHVRIELSDMKPRDIGYYSATVSCSHPENIFPGGKSILKKTCRIIIAPDACYIPPELENGRTWGLWTNLYSLRSSRNWGIGDFTDLKSVLKFASGLHAGFVGINPLHDIPDTSPFGVSPYSPISRFYKNFIYLDIDDIPEVRVCGAARKKINSKNFQKELNSLKSSELIEYDRIALLKKQILRQAFDFFYSGDYKKNGPRSKEFKRYMDGEGTALELYALYSALWEHMHDSYGFCKWQDWPEEFRSPGSDAVREFKTLREKELLFYKFVQWLIDEQHRGAGELVSNLKMPVGIYHDLAIGSVGGGSDSWKYQGLTAGEIDVGAPPDDFNPDGQNWSFPPLVPGILKETGYDFFIQVIRKNMRYNGALRIDHALGLFRLFWIPAGMPAEKGAYVTYPHEDLLRLIALESMRNSTMVIGEDLGTVGENVREALQKFRMLSCRLFYFERNYPDPSFVSPDRYPALALCAITTHDLPTVYGFWAGRDIEVKKQLHMMRDCEMEQHLLADRKRDRELILAALRACGTISNESQAMPALSHECCLAIYEYLARTPCKLVSVSLDDIIGTEDQQNMPGITGSYPNWMRKIPVSIEEIVMDKRFSDLSDMFHRNNR